MRIADVQLVQQFDQELTCLPYANFNVGWLVLRLATFKNINMDIKSSTSTI
jgi:hypothetical protein